MNYSNYNSLNNELVSTWLYIKFRIISLYKSYLNPTTVFEFVGIFLISMPLLFQQIRAQNRDILDDKKALDWSASLSKSKMTPKDTAGLKNTKSRISFLLKMLSIETFINCPVSLH